MSIVIIQTARGVIIAEAGTQQAGQALVDFFGEVVTGAANTFNNYQDAQSLYDQSAAWINNGNAQEAAKVITSSAFGAATTIAFVEYGVGAAVIGGAAATVGVILSPAIMAAAIVAGGAAAGYYAGKYYEYIFDELNRRGEIIGSVVYSIIHPYQIDPATATTYTAAQHWVRPVYRDPLTLDLNGNGLDTVAFNPAAPILFDHTGSGIKQGTGWVAPTDGFLALDRNGNGTIDNGTELFSDSTPLSSGRTAADGFEALAQEDTNGDGVVNTLDARFANLRIWQDLNQDGISQADELTTLAQQGIVSINVRKTENSQVLPGGNEIADLGSYTRSDGSIGGMGITSGMADVNLASDTFHRGVHGVYH